MNSYELYLKEKNLINLKEDNGFINKFYKQLPLLMNVVFILWITTLTFSIILTMNINAVKQNESFYSIYFILCYFIFPSSSFVLITLFLTKKYLKKYFQKIKNKVDIDNIIKEPGYLAFLQKMLLEKFNFNLKKALEKDFEDLEKIEKNKNTANFYYYKHNCVLNFIMVNFQNDFKNNIRCYIYTALEKNVICYFQNRKFEYDLNTTKSFIEHKNLLIKLLSLIDLDKNEKEKAKKLKEELMEKVEKIELENEKENFLNQLT